MVAAREKGQDTGGANAPRRKQFNIGAQIEQLVATIQKS